MVQPPKKQEAIKYFVPSNAGLSKVYAYQLHYKIEVVSDDRVASKVDCEGVLIMAGWVKCIEEEQCKQGVEQGKLE